MYKRDEEAAVEAMASTGSLSYRQPIRGCTTESWSCRQESRRTLLLEFYSTWILL